MIMQSSGYSGHPRWSTIPPVYLFMLAILVLAVLSMAALHASGGRELWTGLLIGGWICVWVGFLVWIARFRELGGGEMR